MQEGYVINDSPESTKERPTIGHSPQGFLSSAVVPAATTSSTSSVRTPPTYKCPHGRPCYFLSTNWPTVIYGSKYFFPNTPIFLFFYFFSIRRLPPWMPPMLGRHPLHH